MIKDNSFKKADYPNRIPQFHINAQRYKETGEEQARRILKNLDWNKLEKIGKNKEV